MGFIQRSICVLILTATLQHASSFLLPRLIARKASPPPAPLQYSVTDVAPSPTADLFTLPRGERTLRILESVENSDEAGGAGSGLSVATFQRLEKAWEGVKSMPKSKKEAGKAPVFVTESATPLQEGEPEFDAVVCGGTLGIFMAGALQNKGFRVCVVERDALKGRVQEWNLSRRELYELVKAGVITERDMEDSIKGEFNPMRVGFMADDQPFEIFTEDVLNLGVSPALLIERAKERFLAAGGTIREKTAVDGITVHSNGAALHVKDTGLNITARLVIDSMGHMSPITRQTRWGEKPDGICMVVGSCASGFDPATNTQGDLLYSNTPIFDKGSSAVQYFWESFPASSGPGDRTSYMFTYFDAHPKRPKLVDVMEDYWDLMPQYQGVSPKDLRFKRVLCGFFPTYRRSPLKTHFDRVCAIGDASGMQSPLSFGGFGALTRHIHRLTNAFAEALQTDCLTKGNLRLINGYQPNLSATWLFQRSMGVRVGAKPDPHFINRILSRNFRAFLDLGDAVLKPFLQDVVQLVPLSKAMVKIMIMDPFSMPFVLKHVGLPAFLGWVRHVFMLAVYTAMHHLSNTIKLHAILSGRLSYFYNRQREKWTYGSGLDYAHASAATASVAPAV